MIPGHAFNSRKPDAFSITQLVELPRLRAEHAPEVMRGFTFNCRGALRELFHEKPSAHLAILSRRGHRGKRYRRGGENAQRSDGANRYPKMSLTLSKMEEPRSAGLFSTLSEAPSCSMSLR